MLDYFVLLLLNATTGLKLLAVHSDLLGARILDKAIFVLLPSFSDRLQYGVMDIPLPFQQPSLR
jgi:hypothetical protein